MQTAANTSLFFTDISSFKGLRDRYIIHRAELRSQIVFEIAKGLYEQNALLRAADRFCQIADNAYAFRRMDIVEELGEILINAPLPRQYKSIGQYYQALSICRKLGVTPSRSLFERVIDNAPLRYKARAMVSLGTTFVQTGDLRSARELYNDALKASPNNWADYQSIVLSHKMIAVAKSIEGDHPGALEGLRRLFPLARMVGKTSPQVFNDYLNGCAVELMEVGRLEEARNISNIVLASDYAFAYPEWRETKADIERKGRRSSRSFAPVTQRIQNNIVRLPERENISVSQGEPARILHFDWKSMVKEPNDTDDKLPQDATEKDIFLRIVQIATRDGITEKTLWKMLAAVEKIAQEQDKD